MNHTVCVSWYNPERTKPNANIRNNKNKVYAYESQECHLNVVELYITILSNILCLCMDDWSFVNVHFKEMANRACLLAHIDPTTMAHS